MKRDFYGLTWATSEIPDGNMAFAYGEAEVIENRIKWLAGLGLSLDECVAMDMKHGNQVKVVGKDELGLGMRQYDGVDADALVTDKKGVGLWLLTGDCLPIVVYSPQKQVVGLVHAGWKSLDLGVIEETVAEMAKFGCDSPTLRVGIGPGIAKSSFVKKNPSQLGKPEWQPFVNAVGNEEYEVDLVGFAVSRFEELGVKGERIEVVDEDTYRSEWFFSHMRARDNGEADGRFATVVMMG